MRLQSARGLPGVAAVCHLLAANLVYVAGTELQRGPRRHTFFKFMLSSDSCLSHRPERGTWPTPELVSGDITDGHGCGRHSKMQTVVVASPLWFPKLELLSQRVSVAILKAFVARSCNRIYTRT